MVANLPPHHIVVFYRYLSTIPLLLLLTGTVTKAGLLKKGTSDKRVCQMFAIQKNS